MNNIIEDVDLTYSTYGDGKARIEILNIGFEPLLFPDEYTIYKEIGDIKYKINGHNRTLSFINGKLPYLNDEEPYYTWLQKIKTPIVDIVAILKSKEKEKEDIFRNMLKANIGKLRQVYDDRESLNLKISLEALQFSKVI